MNADDWTEAAKILMSADDEYLRLQERDRIRVPCCWKCTPNYTRMLLCSICGNKRCPHASDHDLACTGSNEPGQPGSLFPDWRLPR